ncbi:MAG: DUF4838 domain-containing protein [Planctomycetales bacterium]|nr:DUF4838 domain-containing protein [Planctomycetales bacterium]
MRTITTILTLGLFVLVLPAQGAELELVKDGVSQAPVVVFKDAPPYTQRAAEELASYIEKISGAKPAILEGEQAPIPERAIWIGYQPQVAKLFPEVDFDFQHPEEILIAANEKHLVIAGRDRWDPDHLVVEGLDEKIVGKQSEYGTANAVYTFLQDQLEVRWLWPGELGEDVPHRKTISIAPIVCRHHPQIRARSGLFHFSALSNRGYGRAQEWSRQQRLQLSSLEMNGGHAFTDWWERFHETHREYFALQPDGERSGFPNPRTVKLCQSNSSVWKQWLKDVEDQLKQDPTRKVFSASPNDGWASGHCTCEDCRAWDPPDGEPRQFHWESGNEIRPALSDRYVTFANHLAALLKERYPDKEYFVLMLAYGHSRPAPVKAVPADNVIMISVANFFGRSNDDDRGSLRGATHRDQFAAWGKVTPNLIWRPNTGSPAGWQQGLPDVSMTQLAEDFRFVAENHCVGVYVDSVWEHWATQGPQYYLMAQLAWNPRADAEAVLTDYYRRAFGPAAEHVRAYFTVFEEARQAHVEKYGGRAGLSKFTELYTAELLKQANHELDQAASAVAAGPETYRRRVEFVAAGFEYTHRVVENVHFMEHYWNEPKESLAQKVLANWEAIQEILAVHPYALNPGPIRPTTPRMAGLHPEHPARKWKPEPTSQRPPDLDLD